jgi:hypothetical protein
MATSMTHLAPLTWRGFCLAAPAPSAESPRGILRASAGSQRRGQGAQNKRPACGVLP